MNRVLGILSLCLFGITTIQAQSTVKDLVNGFFMEYEAGDPGSAFAYANALRPEEEGKRGALNVADLQAKFIELENQFGKYYGYDILVERELGPNFVRFVCFARYEYRPVRFTFEFYRPNGTWHLYALRIDRRMNTEIKEQSSKTFEFRY